MNIFHAIADKTITSKTTLTYKGETVKGYKLAPCFFHAVDTFMNRVCVVFFDGTEATVDHTELEVK